MFDNGFAAAEWCRLHYHRLFLDLDRQFAVADCGSGYPDRAIDDDRAGTRIDDNPRRWRRWRDFQCFDSCHHPHTLIYSFGRSDTDRRAVDQLCRSDTEHAVYRIGNQSGIGKILTNQVEGEGVRQIETCIDRALHRCTAVDTTGRRNVDR